jgi:hypothetical protein
MVERPSPVILTTTAMRRKTGAAVWAMSALEAGVSGGDRRMGVSSFDVLA